MCVLIYTCWSGSANLWCRWSVARHYAIRTVRGDRADQCDYVLFCKPVKCVWKHTSQQRCNVIEGCWRHTATPGGDHEHFHMTDGFVYMWLVLLQRPGRVSLPHKHATWSNVTQDQRWPLLVWMYSNWPQVSYNLKLFFAQSWLTVRNWNT